MVFSRVCFIVTLTSITALLADKIYIPGQNESIGISNGWLTFQNSEFGMSWNYNRPKNRLPNWEVCFSTGSILLTGAFSLLPTLNSVFVEVSFIGRLCSQLKHKPLNCTEKLSLGAYVSNETSITKNKQNQDYVDFPAAKQTVDYFKVEEMFEIDNLNGTTKIQYLLNSKNSCGSVDNIKVFYYNCPTLQSLAEFSITNAPSKNMGVKRIYGKCVQNSTSNYYYNHPYIDCTWNGTGTVVNSCHCKKGYTKVATECKEESNSYTSAIIVLTGFVSAIVVACVIAVMLIKRRTQSNDIENETMKMDRKVIYVDPSTYSKVDDAVEEFALELKRKSIKTGHLVGAGEFGEVFKGTLIIGDRSFDVAIKTLKSGASDEDRSDFLSEAAIVGQFSDPNVINLKGVVLIDHPNLIVLEYMDHGSLDRHLVKNDGRLSIQGLLGMSRDVASGMKYLAELGYIHRDLAARNILINSEVICKIADFGMSRKLKNEDIYCIIKDCKIPIKWTSPEAIEHDKYTTSSDVWSYGILMWEIFSFGKKPYPAFSNQAVIKKVSKGYRMSPPMDCPKVVHDMMLQCWDKDRRNRPRFHDIFEQVKDWLKEESELLTAVKNRNQNTDAINDGMITPDALQAPDLSYLRAIDGKSESNDYQTLIV